MEDPRYTVSIDAPVRQGTTEVVTLTLNYELTPEVVAAMRQEIHGVPGLVVTHVPGGTVIVVTAYSEWRHYRGRVLKWLEKNLAETIGDVRVSRIVYTPTGQDVVADVTDPEEAHIRRTWVGWPEECDEQ